MFSSNTAQVSSDTANYIEDVFSTYLYTGSASAIAVNNGIDLTTKGGMVWLKQRNSTGTNPTNSGYATGNHYIFDTARTNQNVLCPSAAVGQDTSFGGGYFNFLTNGFNTGNGGNGYTNVTGGIFAGWTFRKQAKFFDVITWTGTGSGTNRELQHNLGSLPGCIIVKSCGDNTPNTNNWMVWHRSLTGTITPSSNGGLDASWPYGVALNSTGGRGVYNAWLYNAGTTSIGLNYFNNSGVAYVAYLFAHDAGGFGLTGTDNVITCGSVTADGSGNATVNLGYEPQWLLVKSSSAVNNWVIIDTMRGLPATGFGTFLFPNTSAAESSGGLVNINATGFYANATLSASETYIYIAIRRPMKTPTTGTSVYNAIARTGTSATATVAGVGFTPDLTIIRGRDTGYSWRWGDRLRGKSNVLRTTNGAAELTTEADLNSFDVDGISLTGSGPSLSNSSGVAYINHFFRRAPGFFDIVCYTGTESSITNFNHNLRVLPELIIIKSRTQGPDGDFAWLGWWAMASKASGSYLFGPAGNSGLNNTGSGYDSSFAMSPPNFTTTTFNPYYVTQQSGNIGIAGNMLAERYVAYLYATCPGVSKVGTYTGTGTTLQVPCGFTAGARFVLIKRASGGAGAWFVWDSTRGITSGNDPYLTLNSTDAEVTTTDYIDPYSAGFEISSSAPLAINSSGSAYIFLAIA